MVLISYILILVGFILCALLIKSDKERKVWEHIAKAEARDLEELHGFIEDFYQMP